MLSKIKELIIKYNELITYVFFGALATFVNWAAYAVSTFLIIPKGTDGTEKQIAVCSAIAWVAGVLFAFVTNKLWVFRSKSREPKVVVREFVSFVGARGVTGLLEVFGVPFLVWIGLNQTIFGVEGAIAKVIVSVAVVILNYVFSKLIVFRKKKQ